MRLRTPNWNGPTASGRWLAKQIFAALCGAILCALLFGFLGAISHQASLGASIGALVGAFLGCGLLTGVLGSFVVWVVGFCILGAILGPGIDADPVSSALVGAGFGVFFAITKWRGLLVLMGGVLGLNIAAAISHSGPSGILGMGVGALIGFGIGHAISPLKLDERTSGSGDSP